MLLTKEQYAKLAELTDTLETTPAEFARGLVLERIATAEEVVTQV